MISGGVEFITPSFISGWLLLSSLKPIKEIKLVYGKHLISLSQVNIYRNDICKLFNISFCTGFKLIFPPQLPPLFSNDYPRIIAYDESLESEYDVRLIRDPGSTPRKLELILNNEDMYGLDGNVDGIFNQSFIVGWVGKEYLKSDLIIWLQSNGLEPIKFNCNIIRSDLSTINTRSDFGFKIDINRLPKCWSNKYIWLSFDRDGFFEIPKTTNLKLP